MKNITDLFKLLTDEQRIRILMLLEKKELSVCQIMGIIGTSQPLISRNLSLLYGGGFLEERREGKLRFYSIRKELPADRRAVLDLLLDLAKADSKYSDDMTTLRECAEFQKKEGRCDMATLEKFMKLKRRRNKNV